MNTKSLLCEIDTSPWGQGVAKTMAHLLQEIEQGEAILTKHKNGHIIRNIISICASVYFINDLGKKLKLIEEKQIFKDGRERKRKSNFSISEKIRPDENIISALKRGLKEELGLKNQIKIEAKGIIKSVRKSTSYPGIKTRSIIHNFDVHIDPHDFKPEGYIEHQPDKDNYFIWQKI